MTRFPGFTPADLRFLTQLKRHNTKEWFAANRHTYDESLKPRLTTLVEAIDDRLAIAAPEIVGDVKRSVFRIYRDVRFSKDKSPYKTHVAAWFFHRRAGKGVASSSPDGGAAGFYVHVEPGASFCGGGMWMPMRPQLLRIRDAIAAKPDVFAATLAGPFARTFGALSTEAMLVRMPRGYDESHPAAAWMRYQSFTAERPLTNDELASSRLPERIVKDFVKMLPFVRFLNQALGFPPDERRVV
jgi:uncharacterized protein (TIGR02453 family)